MIIGPLGQLANMFKAGKFLMALGGLGSIGHGFYQSYQDFRNRDIEAGWLLLLTSSFGSVGWARQYGPGVKDFWNGLGNRGSISFKDANPNSLNPNEINFSQRTVSDNVDTYTRDMLMGNWNWERSGPIRVMERDGIWVSYDNRRLMAAQNAGLSRVPVETVRPTDIFPGGSKTWEVKYQSRFNHHWNIQAGGNVPNTGLQIQPIKVPSRRN